MSKFAHGLLNHGSLKFLIQLGFTGFYSGTSSSKTPLSCIGSGSCWSISRPEKTTSHVASLRSLDGFKVIAETAPCGAVRHGAECCNLYFPQELDDEYLIVWQGFSGKPWDYKTEAKPRAFDRRSGLGWVRGLLYILLFFFPRFLIFIV